MRKTKGDSSTTGALGDKPTLITAQGDIKAATLADLLQKQVKLTNCTLILPAEGSGLGLQGGMLCNSDSPESLDVSTVEHQNHPERTRLILNAETEYSPGAGEKVAFDRKVGDQRIVIVKQKQTKRVVKVSAACGIVSRMSLYTCSGMHTAIPITLESWTILSRSSRNALADSRPLGAGYFSRSTKRKN